MTDLVGQHLGNYVVTRLLGRGGFASVYLGEHQNLRTFAAIKVLHTYLNEQDAQHFVKEARLLASLSHPYIVRVLDYAIQDGLPFLVMEYLPHGTLRKRHPEGTRVLAESIVLYMEQVASALQYAHDQRLIHRDVKPENLLLTARDEVLLSDFGLALLAPTTGSMSTQAMEPAMRGTVPYLAPEQLQGKTRPASDQYALGIMVYEWLCGIRPFRGSPLEIATQHLSVLPPPLREQIPDLSPAIEEVVLRALAKDPADRFAQVQEFADAFARAAKEVLTRSSHHHVQDEAPPLLPSEYPFLENIRSKPAPIWKMPPTFTKLFGREKDIIAIGELLTRSEIRLLTLVGTGGVGKTRLSIKVATDMRERFADGVCFVSLALISDPAMVVHTIAQALDVTEVASRPLFDGLKAMLHQRDLLLVLDNFEHVVEGAFHLVDLLVACPHLKLLVTSRAPLRMQGEQQFPVHALALPDLKQLTADDDPMHHAAVALFVQRAQTIKPDFRLTFTNARAIAEVCVRLDGLPLAIELAAASIKLLSPQLLLARLSQRLGVLTSGTRDAPVRQQTLRNTVKWSYDLLDLKQKSIFQRLSIFVGGCTLEAAEAVCSTYGKGESVLECLTSLIDMNLLQSIERESGGEVRLWMLETIREYALECLDECGEAEAIRCAHAHYYLTLAEEAEPELKGVRQDQWQVRLDQEQDNLRAAFWWFIKYQEAEPALRFCGALRLFWRRSRLIWDQPEYGWFSEGRRWLEAALRLGSSEKATEAQARALWIAGELAYIQDDNETARLHLEKSIVLSRALGCTKDLSIALGILGSVVSKLEGHAAASLLLEESETLCRSLESSWELADLLRRRAQHAAQDAYLRQAIDYAQEGLTLARKLGDRSLAAIILSTLGGIAARQGDILQAIAYNRENLSLARELNDKLLTALTLNNVAYFTALQEGQPLVTDAEDAQDALKLARELGDRLQINRILHTLGLIALRQNDPEQALKWFREGLSQALELASGEGIGWHLSGLAKVARVKGQFLQAAHLFGAMTRSLKMEVDMYPLEQAEHMRAIEDLRARLGEKVFRAAWSEGQNMTEEQFFSAQIPSLNLPKPSLPSSANSRPAYPDKLTAREVEVLRLVARGLTNVQVGEQLVISPRTVNTHLISIFGKIKVSSRSAATRYAIEHQIV